MMDSATNRKEDHMKDTEPQPTKCQHNCTNPPHFPPHCGCPAGFTA